MIISPVIELTTAQHDLLGALGEKPARVIDPRDNATYVLLPMAEYDAVREMLDDEAQQRVVRRVAMRNAVTRAAD